MDAIQDGERGQSGKLPKGLLLAGAAVLVGLAIGLVVWSGLPSRVDEPSDQGSIAESGEVGPIALPDDGAGGLPVAPEEGALAPNFSLETPDGDTYTLSELRGQPVLINFWATWCGPCRLEMPAIQAIYETRAEDGFVVLAVNHTSTDSVPAITDFAQELGLSFPLLVDPGSEVNTDYRVRAYPSSFFVDGEGVIQTVHFGPMTEEQLDGYVNDLLQ